VKCTDIILHDIPRKGRLASRLNTSRHHQMFLKKIRLVTRVSWRS
jgi:hypothetical protein